MIFSGTSEGRRLSKMLSSEGIVHFVCVATGYGQNIMPSSDIVTVNAGRLDADGMREYMAEQAGLLADAMQERTGFSFSLSVRHDSSIEEADIFRDTRVPFETTKEKEEASTKALYGIAKAFLDFVKEMA